MNNPEKNAKKCCTRAQPKAAKISIFEEIDALHSVSTSPSIDSPFPFDHPFGGGKLCYTVT